MNTNLDNRELQIYPFWTGKISNVEYNLYYRYNTTMRLRTYTLDGKVWFTGANQLTEKLVVAPCGHVTVRMFYKPDAQCHNCRCK